jgi:hypothetical protein
MMNDFYFIHGQLVKVCLLFSRNPHAHSGTIDKSVNVSD